MLNLTNIKKLTNEALQVRKYWNHIYVGKRSDRIADFSYNINNRLIFNFDTTENCDNIIKYVKYLQNKKVLDKDYNINSYYKIEDMTKTNNIIKENETTYFNNILINTNVTIKYENIGDREKKEYTVLKNKKLNKLVVCNKKYLQCFKNDSIFYLNEYSNIITVKTDTNEIEALIFCLDKLNINNKQIEIKDYINSLL